MGSLSPVRSAAISKFFSLLESRHGNLRELVDTASIATVPQLSRESLLDLFEHRVTALRVRNYYSPDKCEKLADMFVKDKDRKNWNISQGTTLQASDTDSIGTPYNVALGQGPTAVASYFAEAVSRVFSFLCHLVCFFSRTRGL
jgi:hypothetical protein